MKAGELVSQNIKINGSTLDSNIEVFATNVEKHFNGDRIVSGVSQRISSGNWSTVSHFGQPADED